jgi:glycerol uptake facilitator protein
MAPFVIGILIVGIGFAFGANSGWAINPARDLGPRLFEWFAGWTTAWRAASGSLYFWVPIIGPLIGGLIGAAAYDFFVGRFLPIEPEVGEADSSHPRADETHASGGA